MNCIQLRRALGMLAACALVTACKQSNPPPPPPENPTAGAEKTATTVTTRIYITGLVMVVPPNKPNSATYVLVPNKVGHSAVLGVGFQPGSPPGPANFCLDGAAAPPQAIHSGMCYVDLRKWKVDAIGGSSANTQPVDLEQQFGVLNVSRGAGAGHKVDIPAIRKLLASEIVLTAGAPKSSCSLGQWTFKPKGSTPRPVANVLVWEMPLNSGAVLRFRKKVAPFDIVDVPLLPATGPVELVLANVPTTDIGQFPPTTYGGPTEAPPEQDSLAYDFDLFYDVVKVNPAPVDHPTRPLPHFHDVEKPACGVEVSTLRVSADTMAVGIVHSGMDVQPDTTATITVGVKTFACMPATGDLYP